MSSTPRNRPHLTAVSSTSLGAEPTLKTDFGSGGGNGGGMDDVLKRLHTVEQTVSEIRSDVAGVKAGIPHLATKADISDVKTCVSTVESSLIKWIVGTLLAAAVLAFTIARYVAPPG